MVFPGLTRIKDKLGHAVSRRFVEYRRSCGVTRPRVSFHGFRVNFVTALDQAAVRSEDIAIIVGHERGFTLERYSKEGPGMKGLKQIVEKVRYDGLKLDRLNRS
jgi:hypothetical protein